VCERLRATARWPDGADDVQETMLRLWHRLGAEAVSMDALRLGHHILRRCRIDRLRRRHLALLGDAITEMGAMDDASGQPMQDGLPVELGGHFTASENRLLEAICSGVTANKALARVLETSPSAVRRRRLRLQQSLRKMLASVDAGEIPPVRWRLRR
jgi:hypothetical protein